MTISKEEPVYRQAQNQNKATNICNVEHFAQSVKDHMSANWIDFQGELLLDGQFHRFSTDQNKNKRDEWYVGAQWLYHGHTYTAVSYGSWTFSDAKYVYRSWEVEGNTLSPEQVKYAKQQQADLEKQVERERIQGYETAAKEVLEIWRSGKEFPYLDGHDAYSKSKNMEPTNVRYGIYHDGTPAMLVPMYDIHDELKSIQYIFQKDGKFHKRFYYRAQKKGCFCYIGVLKGSERIFICEGYDIIIFCK